MEKCQRCKVKDSSLQCMNCSSFRSLCSRCDSFIHSLPTKQNHTRIPTTIASGEQTIIPSPFVKTEVNTINENKQNEPSEQIVLPVQPEPTSASSSVLNSKFFYSNQYTKDYVNEIKNVFKKEKNELEFKNKTLQNNLDRLKISFTEQMNNVTNELEEIQKNNQIALNAIKEEYEKKLSQMENEHQIEVESLKNDISHLEQTKNEQTELSIREKDDSSKVIANLNSRIRELEEIIRSKDEELFKLKNSFDVMMTQNEQMLKDQKQQIVSEYEDKIEKIVTDVDLTRDKLLKLVDEREIDIKNIIDSNKTEIMKLNEVIKKQQEDMECHKINLVKIRDERDFFRCQLEQMKQNENSFICDSKMQMNEINRLDEENRKLSAENDDLKVQLSKLDKMIYGKIRPNFKC